MYRFGSVAVLKQRFGWQVDAVRFFRRFLRFGSQFLAAPKIKFHKPLTKHRSIHTSQMVLPPISTTAATSRLLLPLLAGVRFSQASGPKIPMCVLPHVAPGPSPAAGRELFAGFRPWPSQYTTRFFHTRFWMLWNKVLTFQKMP